jgi:hypothetical protein
MKKKIWVILSIVLVIAAAVAVYFLFFNKEGENGASASGTETIQVPDGGPKVEVKFEGPAELKMTWNEVGIKSYQFFVDGVLTNISKNTVVTIEAGGVTFFLDSTPQGVWNPFTEYTLNPGESVGIKAGFPIVEAKAFIVKVKARTSVISTPTEIPTETTTPTTTTPVKNPKTSQEVAIKWIYLMDEKNFSEAEKLMDPVPPEEYRENFWESYWTFWKKGVPSIVSLNVEKEEIISDTERWVSVIIRTPDFRSESILLKLIDGEWKVDISG